MKNKNYKILGIVTLLIVLFVTNSSYQAKLAPNDVFYKYRDSLNAQEESELETWAGYMQFDMYQEYYDQWISQGIIWESVTEILLNEGYYREYIDDMKEMGVLRADYQLPSEKKSSGSSTASTAVQAATPAPVTTEKCTEKTMWAKAAVNMRENGSTDYKKVGSLKAGEQVTLTGIDSTGWYEIKKADGTVGHVSDKYLTEVDPSVSTSAKVEETPEEIPSPAATAAEEIKSSALEGETKIEATDKPEATAMPTIEPAENPDAEQKTVNSALYWLIGLAGCAVLSAVGIVIGKKKK